MTKPGHEAPLLDNSNPSDMTPHADEAQLRIGQDKPEPKKIEVVASTPGLDLTDKEKTRIDGLMQHGYDHGTAALYTVSAAKARRIIGHHNAELQVTKLGRAIEEGEAQETKVGPSDNEIIQLLRGPSPKDTDLTAGPGDEAA